MALVRASVRVGRRTKRLRLVGKRILAETPSQRRNRVVTNKQFPHPEQTKVGYHGHPCKRCDRHRVSLFLSYRLAMFKIVRSALPCLLLVLTLTGKGNVPVRELLGDLLG